MARWISCTALALAGVLVLLIAPSVAGGTGSPRDFAVGGGKHAGGLQFAFSAHSDANGENAKGNIQLFIAGDMHPATVTCLIVSGNEAIMTATSDAVPGGIVVVDAVDNGGPTSGSPDLLRGSFEGFIYESPERPGCFLPVLPPVPVDKGNIIVHDAIG